MKKWLVCALALMLALSGLQALADRGAVLKRDSAVYGDAAMTRPLAVWPEYAAVVVKDVRDGRAELSWGGRSVWTSGKNLAWPWQTVLKKLADSSIETTEDTGRYVKRNCRVYNYPDTRAASRRIRKGTILCGCGEKDGWSLVMDLENVYYGYVRTSNLDGLSFGDGSRFALK